jgi:uncharacterized membrane protein YjgN (DUF898 family)
MDFNDIQSAWNNEKTPEVVLPTNLDKLATVNMPLEKIRKNLKNELIMQIASIGIIGLIPVFLEFSDTLCFAFYLLFLPFLSISAYFLIKLYNFYKRINIQQLSTKDSLYETYYDIMLNIQLYKSFTYSIVPFALVFVGMIFLNDHTAQELTQFLSAEKQSKMLGFVVGLFIGLTVSVGFVTEWWVQKFYGKYAKEIRTVLDELKEE